MFLLKVIKTLDKFKINYAIVGGYAVVLHGFNRGTLDIDLIIHSTIKAYRSIVKALAEINLTTRLPLSADEVFNFKEEYIKNRNLHAWTFVNFDNPSEIVEIILSTDLKNQKIKKIKFLDSIIKVLAIDELIAMKKKSGREQDSMDIQALSQIKVIPQHEK